MTSQDPPLGTASPASGKVIGGVCARLAVATGLSANVVRAAWVALALVLAAVEPVAFWVVVAPYAIAWYLSSRSASPPEPHGGSVSQPPAPVNPRVPDHATPSEGRPTEEVSEGLPAGASGKPTDPGPPVAAPGARPYLQEFARYLWSTKTTPRPIYKTWAHGFVVSELDLPKEKVTTNLMFPRMPYGRIVVWPGWFVFMTESLTEPGRVPTGGKMLTVVLDGYREYRRFASIFRVLRTAHASLTKEQRDIFERALVNPNSIILPLSQVRAFHQERNALNPRLMIQTHDGRELMFGPNGLFELGASFWRLVMGFFGPWHPKLQKILGDAVNTEGDMDGHP